MVSYTTWGSSGISSTTELYISHVGQKTGFSMFIVIVQTKIEYQQLVAIEKEEAVVLMTS